MLGELQEEANKVGLEVHFGKTKILSNVETRRGAERAKSVNVGDKSVEILPVEGTVSYLGRRLSFGAFHDEEVDHRIAKSVIDPRRSSKRQSLTFTDCW